MRMNADKNNYDNTDVYSNLDASYSATYLAPDTQEFSLESVQKKLGNFSQIDEGTQKETVLNADTMPTQQTLTMNYQREYQTGSVVAAGKMTTKTKVAIISYVTVVLALVLGIVLASVAVSGSFAESVALTGNYQDTLDNIAALQNELTIDDEAALAQKAAELGYVSANDSETVTYTRLQTRPAQNFNIESNWFDSLCDWLSGVFGG